MRLKKHLRRRLNGQPCHTRVTAAGRWELCARMCLAARTTRARNAPGATALQARARTPEKALAVHREGATGILHCAPVLRPEDRARTRPPGCPGSARGERAPTRTPHCQRPWLPNGCLCSASPTMSACPCFAIAKTAFAALPAGHTTTYELWDMVVEDMQ